MKRLTTFALLVFLAGCSGGGTKDTGTPLGPQVDGHVYVAFRPPLMLARPGAIPLAAQQTLLAGATVTAYAWPGTGPALATATTDDSGRFSFTMLTHNGLSSGGTYLLVATDANHVVSAPVTVSADIVSVTLAEATYIATLALQRNAVTVPDSAAQHRYRLAAAKAIAAALTADGLVELTTTANAAAAQTAAAAAAAAASGVTPIAPAVVTNLAFNPPQVKYTGGDVQVSLTVTGAGAPVSVYALAWSGGGLPEAVLLTASGTNYSGKLTLPPNTTTSPQRTYVALALDDGLNPPLPTGAATLLTQAEGQIVLDLLTETLVDEPASRRVRVLRGGSRRRTRQVNANQSLRGATVVVDGVPGATGTTGSDGLLLLTVPLHYFEAGPVSVTASLAPRVSYRQYLVLPPGVTLLNGDRIEVDIPLGKQADWTAVATTGYGLPAPDLAKVPLLGVFGVTSALTLGGAVPAGSTFRPLTASSRTDDGDWFATNLAAGAVSLTGIFAPTTSTTLTLPFGPVTISLQAGLVHGVTALLPPWGG